MSEAMSSVEIEDVLSSIRRLVSEDLRPNSKGGGTAKKGEKLLLTPSLRVVADQDDAVPEAAPKEMPQEVPQPITSRATLPRLHLGAEPSVEKLVASLEGTLAAQDVEWESEVGDPAPLIAPMDWTDTDWAGGSDEPDGNTVEPLTTVSAEASSATPSWAQDDPEVGTIANAEPDFAGDMPIAEPDAHWADQAEAEAVAELRFKQAEDASLFSGTGDEMSFDEEVLRDLVRDLIREELQGGLGERITRNVRKLVRAEIARALATKDFE